MRSHRAAAQRFVRCLEIAVRAPDSLIFSLRQAACLAVLTPLIALAQAADSMRDAAHPDAPVAPLVHPAMKPMPPGDDAPAPNAWREAHDAVAAFPRGHADILAWEQQQKQQSAANPPPAPASPRPSGHGAQPAMPPHQHLPVQRGTP
jgi:hypothetical protein